MIRFKEELFWDLFINPETGEVTDSNGNIKHQYLISQKYLCIHAYGKCMPVHRIQAYTYYGYHKGWDVHHRDGNKLNNDLYNLECLPHDKHASITMTGRTSSEKTKQLLREQKLGEKNPQFGKHPSKETRKKMSESRRAYLAKINSSITQV